MCQLKPVPIHPRRRADRNLGSLREQLSLEMLVFTLHSLASASHRTVAGLHKVSGTRWDPED